MDCMEEEDINGAMLWNILTTALEMCEVMLCYISYELASKECERIYKKT
jgi:hypothetical protein